MANQVKVTVQEAIRKYSRAGWSRRKIARTLGINRETVSRYLAFGSPNPAIPPTGADDPKPAIPPTGTRQAKPAIPPTGSSGRVSQCEPFKEVIERALEQGLAAQRIFQDLRTDTAFCGGYDAVKRFVRR
jgi:transposase